VTVDLADAIRDSLPRIKSGSIVVFGDVFGGRIDNVHCVVGATFNPDGSTSVQFDEGETLTIWGADGIDVGRGAFRVATATRIRWEWFYYGRRQLPKNRYFQEHRVEDGRVVATTNADGDQSAFAPDIGRPAFEIL
jgi:hypothetical protein